MTNNTHMYGMMLLMLSKGTGAEEKKAIAPGLLVGNSMVTAMFAGDAIEKLAAERDRANAERVIANDALKELDKQHSALIAAARAVIKGGATKEELAALGELLPKR